MPNLTEYNRHRKIIEAIVPKYYRCLIAAVIDRESAWKASATRWEQGWLERMPNGEQLENKIRREWVTVEPKHIETSYGLMQIMYAVAWEIGCRRAYHDLLIPEVNILWGWLYLQKQIDRYDARPKIQAPRDMMDRHLQQAIAAYNAGSARENVDGEFLNQAYVDFVWGQMAEWREVLK